MRYIMLTYFTQEGADRWETLSPAEQATSVDEHVEWFAGLNERITGGIELSWPRKTAFIRGSGKPVIHDGPFPETKEVLGGAIFLEANSLEEAADLAATWPSLSADDALVCVVPEEVR